jgi:hydroxymethylbilane synthase
VKTIRIATRGSDLARWQANFVREALLRGRAGLRAELVILTTRGDKILDVALEKIPGKGLFTKEVEEALLREDADLAVHSLKDLPTQSSPGLAIAAILPREDPADALITRGGESLADLRRGAGVMTGSVRRSAQLLHHRPDLAILPVRGNVPTRLRKFDESGADGIVLARAGLVRLGLSGRITQRLDPAEFLPACGQGAMAVQTRAGDREVFDLGRTLDDESTRLCVIAERAFLEALGGGCQAPLGAYATVGPLGELRMTGMVASTAGRRRVTKSADTKGGSVQAAEDLGRRVADLARREGIDDLLRPFQQPPALSQEEA